MLKKAPWPLTATKYKLLSNVQLILNLDTMIRLWPILEDKDVCYSSTHKKHGVRLTSGVCCNVGFSSLFYRHTAIGEAIEQFALLHKGTYTFPVAGFEEYRNSPQLYANPVRKDFAYWLRDNLEWNLTRAERFELRIKRILFRNQTKLKCI